MNGFSGDRRAVLVAAVAAGVLGLSACSTGTGVKASDATSSTPTASSATPSESSTPTAGETSAAPSGSPITPTDVVAVPGYAYTTLPDEIAPILDGLDQAGLTTGVVGYGVTEAGDSEVIAALVVAQYTDKITLGLDALPVKDVLDGAIKGATATSTEDVTTTSKVFSGTPVRLVETADLAFAVAYKKGGELIEIFGPTADAVLDFAEAYLAVA